MAQRPRQPVHRPRRHHIKLTAPDALHQPVKAWALIPAFAAADPGVGELSHHLPAVAFSCGRQLTPLVSQRLLIGAHPQVQRDLLCHVIP